MLTYDPHTLESTSSGAVILCSPAEVHRRFGGTYYLFFQGQKVNQKQAAEQNRLACYSSTLKIEAVCFSETSVTVYRTESPLRGNLRSVGNYICITALAICYNTRPPNGEFRQCPLCSFQWLYWARHTDIEKPPAATGKLRADLLSFTQTLHVHETWIYQGFTCLSSGDIRFL
jgi:hypothetical protein